jgi:hypothetical protein
VQLIDMAELTTEQKEVVSQWAADGATLNEIQTRLKGEFGLTMTYMEARLLMMDLEVRIKDKTVKAEPVAAVAVAKDAVPVDAEFDGEEAEVFGLDEEEPEVAGEAGAFAMGADELTVPGMLVSGYATFSDGMNAKWFLDQMGRLTLKTDPPGYQPPAADVPKFQEQLEKILVKRGLY